MVAIAFPPLPILIGLSPSPLSVISALLKLVAPFTVMMSPVSLPIVAPPSTCKLFLIFVVPVVAPITIEVATPKALIVETPVLNTEKTALLVVMLFEKDGFSLNTDLPTPVLSEITPLNWLEVVEANTANVLLV